MTLSKHRSLLCNRFHIKWSQSDSKQILWWWLTGRKWTLFKGFCWVSFTTASRWRPDSGYNHVFLYLCYAPVTNNALQCAGTGLTMHCRNYGVKRQELVIQIKWNHTEKWRLPPWKTAVVANRTCHPWPTSKSLWLTLLKERGIGKVVEEEEREFDLERREAAETRLASCGRKCWWARLNSNETKNTNSPETHFPQTGEPSQARWQSLEKPSHRPAATHHQKNQPGRWELHYIKWF